jgi:hypothetical protein
MQDYSIVFFQYVRRSDVARYLAAGWVVCQINSVCHHQDYAVEMEWDQPGEPPAMDVGPVGDDMAGAGHDWPREG